MMLVHLFGRYPFGSEQRAERIARIAGQVRPGLRLVT
jgi:hypothetical protein